MVSSDDVALHAAALASWEWADLRKPPAWKPERWLSRFMVAARCVAGHCGRYPLTRSSFVLCTSCHAAQLHITSPEDDDVTDETATRSARLAVGIARWALDVVTERGHEGHDLPRSALDAVIEWLAAPEPAREALRVRAKGYWGETMQFEPRRPAELPGASEATRLAVVHLTHAARVATGLACLLGEPAPAVAALASRMLCGDAAHALVATGSGYDEAWRMVMERYTAAGNTVPL